MEDHSDEDIYNSDEYNTIEVNTTPEKLMEAYHQIIKKSPKIK